MLRGLVLSIMLWGGLWGTVAAQTRWHDDFSGEALSAGWERDAAPASGIEVNGGRLWLRGPVNNYCHVERSLGQDLVTVTVLLQPSDPAGVTWSSGVFLYWSPESWCQLSIIEFAGGQYFTAEAAGGREKPSYLARCVPARPHWLRIELGRDVVRYLGRDTAHRNWRHLRSARRPAEWSGAPRLLVLGRGFTSAHDAAYPAPDFDNSYSNPGPSVETWFEEVTVEPTPRQRLGLRAGELSSAGDPVGERLLRLPGDPTYEQIASIYPAMRHPREAVGTKWHPYEVGVGETGALDLGLVVDNGQVRQVTGHLEVGAQQTPFGSGAPPRKALLDGHLPVILARWSHDGVDYEQTALGYVEGFHPEGQLYAYVSLRATSRGRARRVPVAFVVEPQVTNVSPVQGTLEIPAHGSAEWALRALCPIPAGSVPEVLASSEMARVVDLTRRFWREQFAEGMQVQVPSPRLMSGYRAWLAYNALNVDLLRGHPRAHDGAGFYEDVFGCSAARYAWMLDLYGHPSDATAILEGLLADQKPDGLFEWHGGLVDHGATLTALTEHYRLTRDEAWLRRVTPALVAGCEWVRHRRNEQRQPGTLTDGLIQHRPYCDYLTPVYGYLHNASCCAGMEAVAAALRESGEMAVAQDIATEAARYRADILRSMRAATFRRDGREILPMEPDTHRLLKDGSYEAGDYYGLVASMLLDTGFLDPRGREAALITAFLREGGGLRLGVSEFCGLSVGLRGAHTGIDHAYTYGYLENQLILGQPERYLLGLWTSLAYGMTRETFSSVECTQLVSGENEPTLPHLYSATQQLLLLRMMLVREEGDQLILGSAVPRQWLRHGQRVEIRGAVTRFGPVDLSVVASGSGDKLEATIACAARSPLQNMVLYLRQAESKPLCEVRVNGRPWQNFNGETVTLPASSSPLHIRARFAADKGAHY